MLFRIIIALAILVPYLQLVADRPLWLTFVVGLVAFGLGHGIDLFGKRARARAAPAGDSPAPGRRAGEGKKAKLATTAVIVVGSIGMLVYSSLADAEYFKHVNEVMVEPVRWVGKSFKLHGHVEPGSIKEVIVGQKTQRTFVLEYEGQRIMVRSEGPKPDTFKDLAEVVATGRLGKEGEAYVFTAVDLSAKCPSKYNEEKYRSRRPEPRSSL